jgi:hypothetical protein
MGIFITSQFPSLESRRGSGSEPLLTTFQRTPLVASSRPAIAHAVHHSLESRRKWNRSLKSLVVEVGLIGMGKHEEVLERRRFAERTTDFAGKNDRRKGRAESSPPFRSPSCLILNL